MISNLIHMELAHINTSHPDFIGGSRAVEELLERMHADGSDFDVLDPTGSPESTGVMPESETSHRRSRGRDAERDPVDSPVSTGEEYGDNNAFAGFLSQSRKSSGSGSGSGSGAGSGSGGGKRAAAERRATFSPAGAGSASALSLPQMPASVTRAVSVLGSRERMEVEVIKSLLVSYFNIVKKNFADMVPKTIMCFLVNYTKENLQSELVRGLYRDEDRYDDLLKEADDTASRRRACQEMQALLARALEIVHEVREFAVK